MFGGIGINEVAAPQEGMRIAQRQVDNINSKSGKKANIFQAAQVVAGGLQVGADAINERDRLAKKKKIEEDSIEATKAKTDYLTMIMSPSYRDASAANRAEMFENSYKNMASASPAYTEAFTNYSSGQYLSEYDKRGVEEDNAAYNNIGALYKSVEGKVNPTELIETYHAANPRLDKVVMSTAILSELYGEQSFNIASANNAAELQEALKANEEMKVPFKTPFFLNNKSKQGLEGIAKLETELNNVLIAKKKELVLRDKNTIETNPYMSDSEVSTLITNTSYDSATGMLDISKFNVALEKYQKRRTGLEQMNVYEAELDLEQPTSPTKLEVSEIKKKHQGNVTLGLKEALASGSSEQFSNVVHANADFLAEYKAESMGVLFSTAVDEEEQDALWNSTKGILDTEAGYTALKSVYGKDIASIQGVLLLQNLKGFDRATAIERINKFKDNPDQESIIKDVNIALSKLNKDYGPLQDEVKTLLSIAIAGGVDQETALDEVDALMQEHVTDLAGVPAFKITGEIPAVSSKAKEMFDVGVSSQMEVFKEMNGGNPIQVEILNNGKAIVRDATWGYKLKGFIDLKDLANKSEEASMLAEETKLSKETSRLLNATLEPIATGAKGVSDFVGDVYNSMTSPYSEIGKELYDFFNPELSKEKLKKLRDNQSSTSKKIIEENSISLNLGDYFSNPFDLQASEDFTDISQAGVTPIGTDEPGVELSEYGRIDPETGLEVEYTERFSPVAVTQDRLKELEGDYLHKDGGDLITMPYGIVPDLGTLFREDTGEALTSKEVPSDMADLSNKQLKERINTFMAEKSGLERSDYASDKEFASAVLVKFRDNTARAVNEESVYPKEHKWDTMTATQKTVLLDLAWNGGSNLALLNDTKDAVIEGGKLAPNRRTSEMVKIMNNFRDGNSQPRGLLKRRAMAYNLMARPEDIAWSIVTSAEYDDSGTRDGTRYKVKNKAGNVIFEVTRDVTNEVTGELAVPQLPIP